jgi:predicted nuclease of predicted toxin-antitoxin system
LSTNLRLLLDESVTDVLAELIQNSSSAINVEYVRDLSIKGASDSAVMDYAREHRRVVLTTETGMNHISFPICTHPGIIVLAGRRRHELVQSGNFQRFLLSGRRREAQDAVTFVTENDVRIKTHTEELCFKI